MGMTQLITKLLNFATETFLQDNEISHLISEEEGAFLALLVHPSLHKK